MTTARHHRATRVVPESAPAGSLLAGLAAQDFARLGGALTEDACLRALLPAGLREWAAQARTVCPVQQARLADGHRAWVVLGYDAKVAFEELLGRHPGPRLAVDRDALAWAHGDGLVLRGLVSLPVVLGARRG